MAPRDYKRKPGPARRPAAARGGRLGWFLAGAASGVAACALVWFGGLAPPRTVPRASSPTAADGRGPDTARRAAASEAPAAGKPRFEFYTMLPEMEVAVSEEELGGKPASVPEPVAARAPASAGPYLLQAGSFRVLEEADRLKASLAFLGLESGIQTVTINGRDTWHRVRVGPFTDLAALNEARKRLRENRIETIVLRVRN